MTPMTTRTNTHMIMVRCMNEPAPSPASLYRVLSWLSPGYPVGAYSYSHGLEHAIEAGCVHDAHSAGRWIADAVELGAGFADAVFLAAAHCACKAGDDDDLLAVAELAAAYQPTRELALESQAQGRAFLDTTMQVWPCKSLARLCRIWDGPYAYPVVVGTAAGGHRIERDVIAQAYLHAFAANLVSAAVRLVPLGQTDGQRLIAHLQENVLASSTRAVGTDVEELGTCAILIDIASAQHETQYTRLFRS